MAFLRALLALSAASFVSAARRFHPGNGNSFGVPGNTTYDYVVVGGGSAGLAVAMRLAEDGTKTVAVVEAGGFYQVEGGNESVVPALNYMFDPTQPGTANFPLVDWGFVTTPQPGANNRSLNYARGKTLGGSSALNANIYNRGTNESYQAWADIVGDDSYAFDNWLPYFAKGINYSTGIGRAPNATIPTPATDAMDFSPCGGPVHLSHSNFALPFSSWAQQAFLYFGFPNISTFSNGALLGSQYAPNILRPITNERETSETSYLNAALNSERTNLIVYTHSLALQVLFSQNNTATGVLVKSGGLEYVLSASNEIVLSAGVFQSPQLLMLSGVGPAATLQQYNIPVIADRPGVGQNMWDHVDIEVTYKVDVVTFNTLRNETFAEIQKELFYERPAKSLYGSYGADYIGWEKLPAEYCANLSSTAVAQLAEFPPDWPNIEYEIASVVTSNTPGDYSGYGTFVTVPVTPLSRGTVGINSSSMLDPPIIDPQWLTAETDIELAIQAVKRARSIMASPALDPIRIGEEVAPGPSVNTDEEIEQYIRNNFFQNWHAACTCKMGRVSDTLAVVDSRARVIGVQSLRVVDASAFALLPPGHPMSTVFGLAEKISADIVANYE